jgi:putative transposase
MLWVIRAVFSWLRSFCRFRHDLGLEIIALRHQLTVLKRSTKRARLHRTDRLFWVLLRRYFPRWSGSLLMVKPETVVAWHRKAFRAYWRFRSRPKKVGRPSTSSEIRAMVLRMARENCTRGAPRIHGELLKLDVQVSERTVSRYLSPVRRNGNAGQRWRSFLKNHRDVIVGMDFFIVITLNFRILYGLFLIRHGRREILHFNSTEHPTSEWIVQQLREAFLDGSNRYVILDRDKKFGDAVLEFFDSCGMVPVRTSYQSPWQNGVAERWVRSFRNELLDQVIVLDERHLQRLAQNYMNCGSMRLNFERFTSDA